MSIYKVTCNEIFTLYIRYLFNCHAMHSFKMVAASLLRAADSLRMQMQGIRV